MLWKNLRIGQKLFLGFGLITLIMVSVLIYSYINFKKEQAALDLNIHSYEVIREADIVEKSLINMESGARGYAIAGNDNFLEPFNQGKADFVTHFNRIKELTAYNSLQQLKFVDLERSYQSWLEWETSMIIGERRKVNSGQASMEELIATAQTEIGKKDMDNIRLILGEIIKEEQRLLGIRSQELDEMVRLTTLVMSLGGIISAGLAFFIALLIIRIVVTPVEAVTKTFRDVSKGDADFEFRLCVKSKDELGEMAKHFNTFMDKIRNIFTENANEAWLKTGQTELSEKLGGEQDARSLTTNAVSFISKYVNAQIGAIYVNTDNNIFSLYGSYAYKKYEGISEGIKTGEGIIGQAAFEKQTISITNIPKDYIKINSGVGEALPSNIIVTPCIYNDYVKCIIELGAFHPFTDLQMQFIERISPNIAIAVHSAEMRKKTQQLLDEKLFIEEFHLSRFHFRQVQNFINKSKQVLSRRMNRPRKLKLFMG